MGTNAALVGLAIGLFITTNLDDLCILLCFFSYPKFRPPQVALGQILRIATLYAVSFAASLLGLVVSPAAISMSERRSTGRAPTLAGRRLRNAVPPRCSR